MKRVLKSAMQGLGIDSHNRYNDGWSLGPILNILIHKTSVNLIRGWFYKLNWGKASGLVMVGKGVKVYNGKYLQVGSNFIADDYCEIHALSRNGIRCGNRVTIGKYALIRPTNYYGGELGAGLKVGDNSNIGPFSYIGCSGLVEIGNNVLISPRVSIYTENHNFLETRIPIKEQGVTREFVKIEDDCWLASNSVILAGVTVGKGAIVAAGSIVTKDVQAYAIVAGNPAKKLRSRLDSPNAAR